MKRTWPILGVADVDVSLKWYLSLFGQVEPTGPKEHDDWEMIEDDDGTVLVCLHAWGGHGEPAPLRSPADGTTNGTLLFFRVDDFDACLERARQLVPIFEREPEISGPGTLAFTLRDPDGYYVAINAL